MISQPFAEQLVLQHAALEIKHHRAPSPSHGSSLLQFAASNTIPGSTGKIHNESWKVCACLGFENGLS